MTENSPVASVWERWRQFEASRGASRLAAWLGGFGTGTAFVVLASYNESLSMPFAVLVIGLICLSVWFRHFGSIIGAIMAAWLWQPLFTAHFPPSYADMLTFDFARDGQVAFIGIVTPPLAHLASLPLRLLLRRHTGRLSRHTGLRQGVRVAIGLSLASILALSAGEMVQWQVPSSRSFDVSIPSGWTRYEPTIAPGDLMVPVMYGADYSAIQGNARPAFYLYRPPAPMLGITVFAVQAGYDGSYRCDIWPNEAYRTYRANQSVDWKLQRVSAPDADLKALRNDAGDTFFVLEAPRTRLVGIIVQHLCYVMVVSVPATSQLSQSEIDAIFSSLQYR